MVLDTGCWILDKSIKMQALGYYRCHRILDSLCEF